MRCALLAGAVALLAAEAASAEPLPPGSLGLVVGAVSGTGPDAKNLGYGYVLGGAAAWQPMNTQDRVGYSAKWSVLFATMSGANAAKIDSKLLTLQMDLMLGIRVRPGVDASRYLTLRAGAALFRADQLVPPKEQRAFAGGVASVGLDQYFSGWVINVDVRYGLIGNGPTQIGLVIGASKSGP